jgi:hypothetical protein
VVIAPPTRQVHVVSRSTRSSTSSIKATSIQSQKSKYSTSKLDHKCAQLLCTIGPPFADTPSAKPGLGRQKGSKKSPAYSRVPNTTSDDIDLAEKQDRCRGLKGRKNKSAGTKNADATVRNMQTRSMRQKSHAPPRFPKFSHLPKEVQWLIWESALAQEVPFVDAIIDRDSGMASSQGPISSILSVCQSHNPPHGVRAIYVPMEGNDNMGRVRDLVPIYIRPSKDTLYIPFLQRIDWGAFLAREENQCLQRLAITSTTAVSMIHNPNCPSWGLKELKNLKSITLLDGAFQNVLTEGGFDRMRCEYALHDVERGPWSPTHNEWLSGIGIPPHWNLGCMSWIRDGLMETIEDNWKNESWNLPEIAGKMLGRARLEMDGNWSVW